MSTSAASLSLPILQTRQPLSSSQRFSISPSFCLNPNFKSISISAALLPSVFSLPSRFVTRVALSEFDQEEDTFSDDDARSFAEDQKVFVGNLSFNVDSAQLADLFQSSGVVERCEVVYDKTTGRSRGFGFVTLASAAEAEKAAQQLNGYELDGRAIRVNYGPPPRNDSPRFNENPRFRTNYRGGGSSDGYRGGGSSDGYRGGGSSDGYRGGGSSDGYRGGGSSDGYRGGGGGSYGENRVHVGNLAWGVDNLALESLFREQGRVVEAKVIYDRESGRSRGFGFVTFSSPDEVNSAIRSLDGADLNGRAIRVSQADSKPKPQY